MNFPSSHHCATYLDGNAARVAVLIKDVISRRFQVPGREGARQWVWVLDFLTRAAQSRGLHTHTGRLIQLPREDNTMARSKHVVESILPVITASCASFREQVLVACQRRTMHGAVCESHGDKRYPYLSTVSACARMWEGGGSCVLLSSDLRPASQDKQHCSCFGMRTGQMVPAAASAWYSYRREE